MPFCAGRNGGRPPDCSGEFRRHLYGSGDHTGNCRDRAGEEKGQGYLLKISPPLFPRRGGAGSMRGPKGGCEKKHLTNYFFRHNINNNNRTIKPVSKSSRRSVRRSQRAAEGGIAAAAAALNGLTRAIRGRLMPLGATGASPVIKEVRIMGA